MIDKYDEVNIPTLEQLGAYKAIPATDCLYPKCEDCDKYHGHYCTVPMVVSKQNWLLTEALIVSLEKRLTELETLVTDEILRSKEVRKMNLHNDVNYTWDDYFKEQE